MIKRVLFKKSPDPKNISYVGEMLRSEVPTVICGACGKGVCFPIVNQICSANCGAYVFEIVAENDKFGR
jgi:hypothetical protein